MAARDQQQQERKLDTGIEPRRERVALEVIDREERTAERQRDGLAHRHADQHAADETGAGGRGDGVDILGREPCLFQRLADQPVELGQMAARGDLRHHPAERPVLLQLRQHELDDPLALLVHDRDRGLIATGFDT